MKKILFILLGLSMGFTSISHQTGVFAANEEPVIEITSRYLEYDMGPIERAGEVKKVIAVCNKFDTPLAIRDVRSTCGCVRVAMEPQVLDPNTCAQLVLFIDTEEEENAFETVIYILTDETKYEVISLIITANVVINQSQITKDNN